ncbi:MAG TPA: HD-GYP domain-containing protein [Symbiobacteriaceae bacterium]|nr:HD-GYP domain-containing protein [Symbiobacteriaceae bacterium]
MTRHPALPILLAAMLAAGWWIVHVTGGTYNVFTHVMYVPVVLGAVIYERPGGMLVGAVAGLLMGLTPVYISTHELQPLLATVIRSGFYVGMGALVGYSVHRLRRQQRVTQELLLQSVSALTAAMDVNQEETAGHSVRVAELSVAVGSALRLDEAALFSLRVGGLLHDVGKLGVSPAILSKPGRLTPEEYEQIKEHPAAGARILQAFDRTHMGDVYDIVLHHHERLDGSGYPDGLRGSEVSLAARIVAVADVYDALISLRPYRGALPHAEAVRVLREEAAHGRLDGALVEVAIRVVEATGPALQPVTEEVEQAG